MLYLIIYIGIKVRKCIKNITIKGSSITTSHVVIFLGHLIWSPQNEKNEYGTNYLNAFFISSFKDLLKFFLFEVYSCN